MKNIRKNLTGKKMGRLTFIRPLPTPKGKNTRWLCSCECGRTCEVVGSDVMRIRKVGKIRSCGCLRRDTPKSHIIDLRGQRFGRLIVLEYAGSNKHKHTQWVAQCDCGKVLQVTGNNLFHKTSSCGCYRKEVMADLRRAEAMPKESINVLDLLSRLHFLEE